MKSNLQEYLIEDFDLLIQAWVQSGSESTSMLAESLVRFALEKLNGNILESEITSEKFEQTPLSGDLLAAANKAVDDILFG